MFCFCSVLLGIYLEKTVDIVRNLEREEGERHAEKEPQGGFMLGCPYLRSTIRLYETRRYNGEARKHLDHLNVTF